ncbi:MAG: VIT1/CCC1 transporter family protein [Candidatus Diapherotrites archaeon]
MSTSRINVARKGYAEKDLEQTKDAHSHAAFDLEQSQESHGDFVGDIVYGALDGIVTTFAVVAGSAGAGLGAGIILVLGFANLLADGLSMAVGNYLSMKSEQEYYKAERKREAWEVDNYPKGEVEEIRQIYKKKGFTGKNLEKLVELITSKKTVWVDTMMLEELQMFENPKSPLKAGSYTFFSFLVAGFVPLLIFVISLFYPIDPAITFPIAILLTFVTIFAVGSLRSLVIAKNWFNAGMEMLLVGGLTAIVSYGIGYVLGALVL